jgi:hypothetical protein
MAKRKRKKTPAAVRKKPKLLTSKTILAVAIGSQAYNHTFDSMTDSALDTVRPYIKGLIYKLSTKGNVIGSDYTIKYWEVVDATAFFSGLTDVPDLVFCMSRTVLAAASAKFPESAQIPIVGIVSTPADFRANRNVFGISGQRAQKGREYYDKFLDTVPHLRNAGQKLYVLTKKNYPPTDRAFAALPTTSPPTIEEVAVSSLAEIEAAIPNMTPGGLLVLPADLFFGNAPRIIELAQAQKLPDFWPVTDWVRPSLPTPTLPSALAGYGVPQLMCGEMLAEKIADYWSQGWPNTRFRIVNDSDFVWMASIAAAIKREVSIEMAPGLIHV